MSDADGEVGLSRLTLRTFEDIDKVDRDDFLYVDFISCLDDIVDLAWRYREVGTCSVV